MITAVAHTILPAALNLSLEKKGLSQSGSSRANRWLVYKRQVLSPKTGSASLIMLSGNAVWNTVTGNKPGSVSSLRPIALTSGTKVSMSLELWRLDAGPDYPAALESLPVVTVRGEDVTGPRRASSVVSGSASSLLTKRILTTVPRTLVSRLPKHSWPRPKPKTPRPQPLHVVHPAALEVC